jgi:hypothetical protein
MANFRETIPLKHKAALHIYEAILLQNGADQRNGEHAAKCGGQNEQVRPVPEYRYEYKRVYAAELRRQNKKMLPSAEDSMNRCNL